jgi:hypothetical protein
LTFVPFKVVAHCSWFEEPSARLMGSTLNVITPVGIVGEDKQKGAGAFESTYLRVGRCLSL